MDRRLKVLFLSSWFPNRLRPTDGNFVQRHAEAVSTLHDVQIIHAVPQSSQKNQLEIEENTANGIKTLIAYYPESRFSALNFIRRMMAYQKLIQRVQKPDIVHANVLGPTLLFAYILKIRLGIPYVITEHFTDFRPKNVHLLSANRKKLVRFIGNGAYYLLPVTKDLQNGLQSLGIKTPMKVIPNVVDTQLFKPKRNGHHKFTFLHISNLVSRKNPETIIDASISLLKKNYDFILKIGGDAESADFEKVHAKINQSEFKDNFELFGALDSAQVAQKMQTSDCFILFSDDENQPCVISESFSSGISVISSDVGGISEFFPENFGILVQLNQKELEAAMIEMLEDQKRPSAQKIRIYAEETFSVKVIAEQYSEIYHKVLHENFR